MNLAVLTTTYNRADLLARLYSTLCSQTDRDFSWIIIDDGSTDQTSDMVSTFIARSEGAIYYHKTENGGKARAINYAFEHYPNMDFFAVVDSDDFLLDDGIARIRLEAIRFVADDRVGAICFRYYLGSDGQAILGQNVQYSEGCVLGRLEHDAKYGKYDGCIGYYQRVAQKYRYPEYHGESYVGPIVLQMMMEPEFKIVFTDVLIGVAEYQAGGLSQTGRKLRLRNPVGMLHYSGLQQKSPRTSTRVKYAICAQAYAYLARMQARPVPGELRKYLPLYAKPIGSLLGYYWESKYGNS